MFCIHCGTKLSEASAFCSNCGAKTQTDTLPLTEQADENHVSPVEPIQTSPDSSIEKPKKTKKFLVSIVTLFCFIVITTALFFINPGGTFDGVRNMILSDPAVDVITALEDGNHAEALLFAEEADSETLERRLKERLETLEVDFRAENIDFSVLTMELSTILQINDSNNLGLWDVIDTTWNMIERLNASRTAFNIAEELFSRGDYALAIEQYSQVIQDDPNYTRALEGIANATNALRNNILSLADEHTTIGAYEEAIRILDSGLWILPSDSELLQNLTLVEQRFINDSISQADSFVATNNYHSAISVLNRALQVIPNNDQLIRRQNEIDAIRPMGLFELTPINSSGWRPNQGVAEDSLGGRYESPFVVLTWRSSGEYFVDSQYSILRGGIAAHTNHNSFSPQVLIYADGELVYASDPIVRTTMPFNFEIDITGAQFIRIALSSQASGWTSPNILLIDPILER